MAVVISSGVLNTKQPHIGWRAITGTVTASSAVSGYEADRAVAVHTYDGWRPATIPANWQIDAGSAVPVSYCGIGAHDAGTVGATVSVEYWDGSDWVEVATDTPEDDTALFFLFPSVTAQVWRVVVADGQATLGHIRFGAVSVWPRLSGYLGTPIDESRQLTYRQNRSIAGDFLARNVEGKGLQFEIEIQNLSEEFRQGEWRAFNNFLDAGSGTFFVAPKPSQYPLEIAYAWPSDKLRAERTTPNYRISGAVALRCGGYAE